LDLADNQIQDLAPLSALTQLAFLDLEHNQVSDLSPLAKLEHLAHLAISFNSVTDISPVFGLHQLGSLELSGNPLGAMALSRISQLRQEGVAVYFADAPTGVNPSHRVVVFDSSETGNWAVSVLAGDMEITLTESPNVDMQPDLSPDGSKIVLHSQRNKINGIYVVDSSGGNPVRLVQFGAHPSWSPEGKRIAYTTITFCMWSMLMAPTRPRWPHLVTRHSCSSDLPGRPMARRSASWSSSRANAAST